MSEKVLVVAVHADDETLGCGGTLLRHKAEGDKTSWLIVTTMTRDQGYSSNQIAKRQSQINKVAELYGFREVVNLGISAGKVGEVPSAELVKKFSRVIADIEPTTLYLPFLFDVHSDHRAAFAALLSSTKWFRQSSLKRIFMMETSSETDFAIGSNGQIFVPNHFVDVSAFIDDKIRIAKIYESEIGDHPFPRSAKNIDSLATVRGATAGFEFAEAFQLVKERR